MKALALVALLASPAWADEDFGGGSVIFARGGALYRVDAKGKGETEIATLPSKATVRALRTDAEGKILLVDLAFPELGSSGKASSVPASGTWSYLPLDGSANALVDLPCADGPAQLAEDGACVLCRGQKGSLIFNFALKKAFPIPVPPTGARLVATGPNRRLLWADKSGIWSSPPGDPNARKQVAPEAPLRSFLPSPDGSHAVGVYADTVFEGPRKKKPAEVLMGFALDGDGSRRKLIKTGVPVEWSHDNRWILMQDGANACDVHTFGGEYKCWRGYTAASVSPDGRWALVLGNRDGSKLRAPAKDTKKKPPPPPVETDEPSNEHETEVEDPAQTVDVSVAPPKGPLSLYRARLEGMFTEAPALIVKVVDGAAVWVPKKP
jgi:hypothetical protein